MDIQRSTYNYLNNPARHLVHSTSLPLAVFVVAHIPLALIMRQSEVVATIHALLCLAFGLVWSFSGRNLEQVACVGAYIAGSEVLWRMSGANVFWEFGKYVTALVFFVAMLRHDRLAGPAAPLGYFLLLIPSSIISLDTLSSGVARQLISSTLSGPFALFVCGWFGSHIRLDKKQLAHICIAFITPVIGIGAVVLVNIVTAEAIQFTGESNFATSGGFGPNQVSAVLGLGALLCCWCILDKVVSRLGSLALLGISLALATESALTFSRGGLYAAGGALVAAAFFLARDNRTRLQLLFMTALIGSIAVYVIAPGLDTFTNGTLSRRFTEISLTNRGDIVANEIRLWQENLLFGLGPGGGSYYRLAQSLSDERAAAHTEFSRVLAEHGLFGLLSLLILGHALYTNLRRAKSKRQRAILSMIIVWSLLFMSNSAMRLVAPSLLLGFSFTIPQNDDAS